METNVFFWKKTNNKHKTKNKHELFQIIKKWNRTKKTISLSIFKFEKRILQIRFWFLTHKFHSPILIYLTHSAIKTEKQCNKNVCKELVTHLRQRIKINDFWKKNFFHSGSSTLILSFEANSTTAASQNCTFFQISAHRASLQASAE